MTGLWLSATTLVWGSCKTSLTPYEYYEHRQFHFQFQEAFKTFKGARYGL